MGNPCPYCGPKSIGCVGRSAEFTRSPLTEAGRRVVEQYDLDSSDASVDRGGL